MNAFSIYILGAAISGLLFALLTQINSFYDYLCDSIDKSKEEMKKKEDYSLQEKALLDGLDYNTIINFLNIVVSVLSYGGILIIIIYVLSWIIDSITKKFIN